MIDYHAFQQIHHLREKEKLTIAQIARTLGLHWQTVRTWAERPRYERRKAAAAARRASKLDPFKGGNGALAGAASVYGGAAFDADQSAGLHGQLLDPEDVRGHGAAAAGGSVSDADVPARAVRAGRL